MEEKRALLKRYFGHAAFRGGQEALIDAILSGRDVLGVMPTGGGKSVCYQLPALLLPGLTVVVSPLISLMKDQVAALTEAGIPAAFLNSSLSFEQLRSTYAKASAGQYKLLYVAPERLETESFLSLTARVPVSLLAVDEAHCISQWGQDFRPSYLKIAAFLSALPHRPVIAAFTATATAQVRADIIGHLGLANPLCNITGFDRPNLYFEVLHPNSKLANRWSWCRRAREKPVSSTAPRAQASSGCASFCATAALPPRATMQGFPRKNGAKIRTISALTGRASWSRQTPSAWASTNPTSALSFITICQNRWRRIIRRQDAPGATGAPASVSCCTRPAMCRRQNS